MRTLTYKKHSKRIKEAIALYKAFNGNMLWLHAMVKANYISESEAGYISTLDIKDTIC